MPEVRRGRSHDLVAPDARGPAQDPTVMPGEHADFVRLGHPRPRGRGEDLAVDAIGLPGVFKYLNSRD